MFSTDMNMPFVIVVACVWEMVSLYSLGIGLKIAMQNKLALNLL